MSVVRNRRPPQPRQTQLTLTAYRLRRRELTPEIVPAPRWRAWATETNERFANRCLPLLMANQAGWYILGRCEVEVVWRGGPGLDQLEVTSLSPGTRCDAVSHFGHGILTWQIPFLFRTPPRYNLLARGPANSPKDGIQPLEGLVETDWAVAPFTMNWKVTRPDFPIRFQAGEPICMIVPQRRGELEAFAPAIEPIRREQGLRDHYRTWRDSRREFIRRLAEPLESRASRWQQHYFRGRSPSGLRAPEHQTRLELRPFTPEAPPY